MRCVARSGIPQRSMGRKTPIPASPYRHLEAALLAHPRAISPVPRKAPYDRNASTHPAHPADPSGDPREALSERARPGEAPRGFAQDGAARHRVPARSDLGAARVQPSGGRLRVHGGGILPPGRPDDRGGGPRADGRRPRPLRLPRHRVRGSAPAAPEQGDPRPGRERTVSPQAIAQAYSFGHTAPPSRIDPAIFAQIEKAVRERQTLEVVYHTQSRDETGRRRIDPYHLANVDGDWFLLAYCHKHQEVRVFKPARIRAAKATGQRFVPAEFRPGGVPADEARHDGRATGSSRRSSASTRRWPATSSSGTGAAGYKVQTLMSGGVEITFRSENADAVIRWCLSWGPGAEVIAPPWVRRRARQILPRSRGTMRRRSGRCGRRRRRQRPPSRPPSR